MLREIQKIIDSISLSDIFSRDGKWEIVGDKYADTTIFINRDEEGNFTITSKHKVNEEKNHKIASNITLSELQEFIKKEKRLSSHKLIFLIRNYINVIKILASRNSRYALTLVKLNHRVIEDMIEDIRDKERKDLEIGDEILKDFKPLDYKAKNSLSSIENKLKQYNGYTKLHKKFA